MTRQTKYYGAETKITGGLKIAIARQLVHLPSKVHVLKAKNV